MTEPPGLQESINIHQYTSFKDMPWPVLLVPWRYVYSSISLRVISTGTFRPGNISFNAPIYYCDIPIQNGRIVFPHQKVEGLSHVNVSTTETIRP
jgi:hypothetical protein